MSFVADAATDLQANPTALMDATSRVAFAALVHDLGKLTERAGVFDLSSGEGQSNVHVYCPFHEDGRFHSHKHAAATALSIDRIEGDLPPILRGDVTPFASRGDDGDITDSLINAAAMHHKPQTFLQWCVAVADRVASGFERDAFENYNRQKDEHIAARLLTPFEEYGRGKALQISELKWRYPLAPLTSRSLFPEKLEKQADKPESVAAYLSLWQRFVNGLRQIPAAHRQNWPLWLDAFDSLWLTATHAIPAAGAFGTRPDVSLYDHSKAAAAFAAAIWRYHVENGDDLAAVAARQRARADWSEQKFLLIQGDFAGIQAFVFGGAATTQKAGTKLLRGRSALVSLLCELAALKVLDALALPPTAQVVNAAGKFLIVAPNTAGVARNLARVRAEMDRWFLDASFGLASVALATEAASCEDFIGGRFAELRQRLAAGLDRAKRQRFHLASDHAPEAVRTADYSRGVCPFDSRLPAEAGCEYEGTSCSWLSHDQIILGAWLAREKAPLLRVERGEKKDPSGKRLGCDYFGYSIVLASRDKPQAIAARLFDLALPGADANSDCFAGFARRAVNAYVPVVAHDVGADPRYAGIEEKVEHGDIKTFDHLAREARSIDRDHGLKGAAALGVLKGDIDNLGQIFATALGERSTFANWSALSRRVSGFFSYVVPQICVSKPEFRDVYTVFAGGDDFYFIGPWLAIKRFAALLHSTFEGYCADNPNLHFSAAYLMIKPGHPTRAVNERIEEGLEKAKEHERDGRVVKNAIHLGARDKGVTLDWDRFDEFEQQRDALAALAEDFGLTTSYLYNVLAFCDMAENAGNDIAAARWRSLLYYRTRRHLAQTRKLAGDEAATAQSRLLVEIGGGGIDRFGAAYRHIVSDFLYMERD